MIADSTIPPSKESIYEFKLLAILRASSLPLSWTNPNSVLVLLRIGCFDEKWIMMRQKPNATHSSLDVVTDQVVNISIPVIDDVQTKEFKLLDLVEFYTDIDFCTAFKVSAYSDPERTKLTSSSSVVSFKVNPSQKNMTTFEFDPIIVIKYGNN